MKSHFVVIALSIAMASCNFVAGEHESADSTATSDSLLFGGMGRDTTIDSATAYNNLFLDTAAVDTYIRSNKVNAADSQALKAFYDRRNFQYTWFAKDGMTEQARSFWNAYTYANAHNGNKQAIDPGLKARMDTLVDMDTLMVAANDTSMQQTEVALTHQFINYYRNADKQSLVRQLPLSYILPVKKSDPVTMADSLLSLNTDSTITDSTNAFAAMVKQLELYDSIAKKGGWQPINAGVGTIKKGTSSPAVAAIKRRLQATGDYVLTDTSARYNDSLELAVKSYQERNGFKSDGIITDSLISVMNVPVEQRIEQILINMNRIAWMPPQVKEDFVAVNIPDFMLEVHKGDSVPMKMEVVVGKEGSNTMMFTGDMNEVVFNPTWNLPPSIVKEEVLPAMKKDPNYLKRKNMEIVGQNDSLPQIKQLPGATNELGKVKFLFPNSYDIYLHDTRAKGLFAKDKRTFSHGCIRVADAEKLSRYVLSDQGWTPDKIKSAINSNKEESVQVKNPIPVVITYFTTWVDDDGKIHFRDDVYQHDKRTASMMFKPTTGTA